MGIVKSKFGQGSGIVKQLSKPSNIEIKMVDVIKKRKGSRECSVKSFNSVIMKFNKIDESFKKLRGVFQKIDKDFDGKINLNELKHGFQELRVSLTDQEIKELYQECDMDENRGIDFKEFIKSHLLPELEASFKTIVDTFMFFDKDGNGYVMRNEIDQAIIDIGPGQRTSSSDIAFKRFEEMDWNKDGAVSLKEFLFAFINWVSVEDHNDDS